MADQDHIQIVDQNDRPIGGATRQEARRKGLYYRLVKIVIEDAAGNVLLHKRSPQVSIFANCWDNAAGGHVDEGDSYDDAAKRELFEELGIDADLKQIAYYRKESNAEGKILNRFITIYKTIVPRDIKFTLQPKEVSEARWFSTPELRELVQNHPNEIAEGLYDTLEKVHSL